MLDEIKDKAAEILNNEKIKEAVEKAKEFADSEKGKERLRISRKKWRTSSRKKPMEKEFSASARKNN